MSGGHFGYEQDRIRDAAFDVDKLKLANKSEYTDDPYKPETIAKFEETRILLLRVAAMMQRIDWLVSGDDGEETFHERWKKEVPVAPINP